MQGLMIHCGANNVEREQVYAAQAPAPTDTWHPIPHSTLLDLATSSLAENGFAIKSEAHAMTPNLARYFGLFQIQSLATDYDLVVGFRNATDKSFGAGMVVGTQVFVCDNLSFSGEIVIKRRHTPNIMEDLPQLISGAVQRVGDYQVRIAERLQSYKEAEITNRMAEHAIIEMVRRNVISTQKVVKVVKEWDAPRHPEFADGHNVWRLFNAVTETNKGLQLAQPGKDFKLNTIMDELVQEAA